MGKVKPLSKPLVKLSYAVTTVAFAVMLAACGNQGASASAGGSSGSAADVTSASFTQKEVPVFRRSTNKERPLILSTNIGRLDMHVMVFYRGFRHAEPRPVVLQAFVANHVDLV